MSHENVADPRCFRCDEAVTEMPIPSHRCRHRQKCETAPDGLPRCEKCRAFKARARALMGIGEGSK